VKVVESEKAVHVGYFLNGKRQEPFLGEQRLVIPSPRPGTHAQMPPRMSASEVADAAIEALRDPGHRLVTVNLCNVDVIDTLRILQPSVWRSKRWTPRRGGSWRRRAPPA